MTRTRREPRPLALCYHGVDEVPLRLDHAGLFTPPAVVDRHIRWLHRWGYRVVPFSRLAELAARGGAEGHVALTFDDGLADNLHNLLPILRAHDVTATVFICPDLLGDSHPDAPWARLLAPADVQALVAAGVEIGSHGMGHVDLTTLPYEAALSNLRESKSAIEDLTGRPCRVAAYPLGRTSDETAAACRAAGFSAACRTSGTGSWEDPWNLPRQDVGGVETSYLALRLKRDDRFERAMRRAPGRAVRGALRWARSRLG